MPNSSLILKTGFSSMVTQAIASLFDPTPLAKAHFVAPQGQVTVSKRGYGLSSTAKKPDPALARESSSTHLSDRNTLVTLGPSSEGIFIPATGKEGENGECLKDRVKKKTENGRYENDQIGWLRKLQHTSSTWKTCEQLVYTAREKPVGRFPQKLWTTRRTTLPLNQLVDKSPTFPAFPPHPSTQLPTHKSRHSSPLRHHLSAVSTAPMTITTIYITNT